MPDETIRSMTVDNLRYAYRLLRGPAPRTHPIVLLGGVFQGMYDWAPMEKALLPVADVVTLGSDTGDSTAPAIPLAPHLLSRAIAQVIDDLGAEQVNLFGYSYGSVIVHRYAQAHPRRVARLVLGGVPWNIPDARRRLKERAATFSEGQEAALASMLAETMLCMDPDLPVLNRELAYRYVRRTLLQQLRIPHARQALEQGSDMVCDMTADGLDGIPTLVFSGAHDTLIPVPTQRAFAATIAGSSFVVLDSSDHWVLLERPAEVAALALHHFTDLPPAPRGTP
ncbi:alpha/beta fold hydrolase [Streptomyces sp. NPDC029674]|uniref:alpha/beta fold hydrolase n=1 Tax=Streptomyces sp. NPDC029674 TaxID=3365297 RepID=UPI00384E5FA0